MRTDASSFPTNSRKSRGISMFCLLQETEQPFDFPSLEILQSLFPTFPNVLFETFLRAYKFSEWDLGPSALCEKQRSCLSFLRKAQLLRNSLACLPDKRIVRIQTRHHKDRGGNASAWMDWIRIGKSMRWFHKQWNIWLLTKLSKIQIVISIKY